jgi:hypothetical protein
MTAVCSGGWLVGDNSGDVVTRQIVQVRSPGRTGCAIWRPISGRSAADVER